MQKRICAICNFKGDEDLAFSLVWYHRAPFTHYRCLVFKLDVREKILCFDVYQDRNQG